jgi:hypothetical protein
MTQARDLANLIANSKVDGVELSNGAVDTLQLANDAVDTSKLAAGAVTDAKVSSIAGTKITYDNTVSGISANTLQEAVDYLNSLSGGNAGSQASYTRQKFTATAGQTVFTTTAGYQVGYLEVYMNGVLLDITDYAASDGSTVVLAVGASAGDEIVTIALDSFAIAELLRIFSTSASAPNDAVTVDASGSLGIGTSSIASDAKLHVDGTDTVLLITEDSEGEATLRLGDTQGDLSQSFAISYDTGGGSTYFRKDNAIIGRWNSSADFIVGGDAATTPYTILSANNDATKVGVGLRSDGYIAAARYQGEAMNLNRMSNDGAIALFRKDGTTVGSIASQTGKIAVMAKANWGLKLYDQSGNDIVHPVSTSGLEYDGDVSLGYSASRFKDLYLSGGVYLGGVGSANRLDDVEEGTWTPHWVGVTGGVTYSYQQGLYQKVGNVVTVSGYMDYTVSGATGANIRIVMPFDPKGTYSYSYGGPFLRSSGIRSTIDTDNVNLATYTGSTSFYIYRRTDGAVYNGIGDLQSGTVSFCITYHTS